MNTIIIIVAIIITAHFSAWAAYALTGPQGHKNGSNTLTVYNI